MACQRQVRVDRFNGLLNVAAKLDSEERLEELREPLIG